MKASELIKTDRGYRLLVDGKPFLALGGEVHNSSPSDAAYMEEHVWPNVRKLNLNTLIVPVFWELFEPEQGTFDFSLVDSLLRQAEREGVKLVLLWFGLWKNGESTYVPAWMKQDTETYFLVRDRFGKPFHCISPLCTAAVKRDAAAFTQLMTYLREKDINKTVIITQVENEMGVVGEVRDFSPAANDAFHKEAPETAAQLAGKTGTWPELFGEDAPEFFMAYQYAVAVEKIAAAGKAAYDMPMYVNCWMDQFPRIPGNFPSGGPVAHVMDIWKKAAPSVDFLSPDIYLPYFEDICAQFKKPENPLFIPEARPSADSAANVFSAVGKFHALGFAPFAIEDFGSSESGAPGEDVLKILDIDPAAFEKNQQAGDRLGESYALLNNMSDLLLAHYGTDALQGFTQYQLPGTVLSFQRYNIVIRYSREQDASGGGLVVELDKNRFLIAGRNFKFSFCPKTSAETCAQVASIEEGEHKNGAWQKARVLNGDERYIPQLGDCAQALLVTVREVR